MKKILIAAMLLLPLATTASAKWGPNDCYGDYTWSYWRGHCVFSQDMKDKRIENELEQFFHPDPEEIQAYEAAKSKERNDALTRKFMTFYAVSVGITSLVVYFKDEL